LGSLGTQSSVRDYIPVDHLAWFFGTLLLALASAITSVISTVSCVILMTKKDVPASDRRSGLAATALAWASLAIALKIIH